MLYGIIFVTSVIPCTGINIQHTPSIPTPHCAATTHQQVDRALSPAAHTLRSGLNSTAGRLSWCPIVECHVARPATAGRPSEPAADLMVAMAFTSATTQRQARQETLVV